MSDVYQIDILRLKENGSFTFRVEVKDLQGNSTHEVTLSRETYDRLTDGKYAPATCVESAFRFLLDREPKESILSSFNVDRIAQFFPDFERAVPQYLPKI